MLSLLFALQLWLFSHPVTNAHANQVHKDVVVSVTFAEVMPTKVCTSKHQLDDEYFDQPLEAHCWTPKSPICDFDTWEDTSIEDWNFQVVVTYSDRPAEIFYLVTIENS